MKFNRTENVRGIPPSDPDFKALYARRNDAESINRAIDDSMGGDRGRVDDLHNLGLDGPGRDIIRWGPGGDHFDGIGSNDRIFGPSRRCWGQ